MTEDEAYNLQSAELARDFDDATRNATKARNWKRGASLVASVGLLSFLTAMNFAPGKVIDGAAVGGSTLSFAFVADIYRRIYKEEEKVMRNDRLAFAIGQVMLSATKDKIAPPWATQTVDQSTSNYFRLLPANVAVDLAPVSQVEA